jgi:uncharacterized membrane protein
MTTTAWRFSGTEGADEAVLKLKQLEAAKLVEVQDTTVIRWPQYAAEPTIREHVTEEAARFRRSFTSSSIPASIARWSNRPGVT